MRIGIVYDRAEDYSDVTGPDDRFDEFEPESTIAAMEQGILEAGHIPVRIGSPKNLLSRAPDADLIWNIGEGYGSRNREAWVPVLCEMRDIPFLGSDAYALSVTLDKMLAKMIAGNLGIPVTKHHVIRFEGSSESVTYDTASPRPSKDPRNSSDSPDPSDSPDSPESSESTNRQAIPDPELPFPLFLKPRYEGTAKGISEKSVVHSVQEYRSQCRHLLQTYRQDVLVEPFLSGPELTCAVAYHPLQALPVMERGLHTSGIGSHAVDKPGAQLAEKPETSTVSGIITPGLEKKLATWSLTLCKHIGINDFARFDYKIDQSGNPMFLEVNPLPTFGIDSTYAILAEMQDLSYPAFLADIISDGISRLTERPG